MFETKDGPFLGVLLCVGTGAAIGAMTRWALGLWLNSQSAFLPYGTLAANLIGAFVIGLATSWIAGAGLPGCVKLFLVTGLLGALTTFSTFSMENVTMLMNGEYLRSAAHAALHLFGSFAMTACGVFAYRVLA